MKQDLQRVLASPTPFGPCLHTARRRWLEALVHDFRASFAVSVLFVEVDGTPHLAEPTAYGSADVSDVVSRWEGLDARAAMGVAELGADEGDITGISGFSVLGLDACRYSPALARLCQSTDAHSCLRLHVCDQERSFGWYGIFREASQPVFSGRDLRAARTLQCPFMSAVTDLITAHDKAQLSGEAVVVTTGDGEAINYSASARGWLSEPGVRAGLRHRVQQFLAGTRTTDSRLFGRTSLRLDRLDAREQHVVVTASPVPLARISPLSGLTRAQRRVAVLGAGGASINEIATELSRSRETVREHLAAVYRRLGVHRRVDLAKKLGGVSVVSRPRKDAHGSVPTSTAAAHALENASVIPAAITV